MLNEIDDETSVALLSGEDFWTTKPNEALELRSMRFSDGPHGLRINRGGGGLDPSHTVPATCFPTAVTLGSTWDSDLLRQVGDALGEACVRMGVDVLLGPGLNIKRHPHGGRNFEYFSEDPFLSGVLAASMVKGIQTHPVAACPKHFAANNHEANRHVVDVIVDRRTLFEMYLRGFEIVVTESAPRALMCAYNSLNGPQCSEHQELLTGILRQRWGFDGLVMSDWGATRDRAAGIEAGLDLQMPGCAGLFDSEVLEALALGRLERDAIARSIDPWPIERLRLALPVTPHPWRPLHRWILAITSSR